MKKVLVTGASGFIGRAVTELAASQSAWQVHAVISGRKPAAFVTPGIQIEIADLTNPDAREALLQRVQPDIVLHLAWGLDDGSFLNSPANLDWFDASRHLLAFFLAQDGRAGERQFVFAGSSAEYGYRQALCGEDGPARPEDLYGACKLGFGGIARQLCKVAGVAYQELRYFSVYGAGESHVLHVIPKTIKALLAGQAVVCRSPDSCWDYIYIDDAAAATIAAMQTPGVDTVNIASGTPGTMREVFCMIADEIEELHKNNEYSTNKSGGGVSYGCEAPRVLQADTSVLHQTIGCHCTVSLAQGIRKTVRWWAQGMQDKS